MSFETFWNKVISQKSWTDYGGLSQPSEDQVKEARRLYEHAMKNKWPMYSIELNLPIYLNFPLSDIDIVDRHSYCRNNRRLTEEKMRYRWGDKAWKEKWDQYRAKQAYSNSLEYKSKKTGMDAEQFAKYNKRRACTLDNLISRHGEEEGAKKWQEYCKRQSYTKSFSYFKDKYGHEAEEKWKEVNSKKAHTMENYIRLYGEVEAPKKLMDFYQKLNNTGFVSKSSQEFFRKLDHVIPGNDLWFQEKNGNEFALYDERTRSIFMYDCVSMKKNIIIEFHGDYYHCNPTDYSPDYYHPKRKMTAQEIWEFDENKKQVAIKEGFAYYYVWESEALSKIDSFAKLIGNFDETNYTLF